MQAPIPTAPNIAVRPLQPETLRQDPCTDTLIQDFRLYLGYHAIIVSRYYAGDHVRTLLPILETIEDLVNLVTLPSCKRNFDGVPRDPPPRYYSALYAIKKLPASFPTTVTTNWVLTLPAILQDYVARYKRCSERLAALWQRTDLKDEPHLRKLMHKALIKLKSLVDSTARAKSDHLVLMTESLERRDVKKAPTDYEVFSAFLYATIPDG